MRISDSFKFFNPLWLVQNVFTTHIQPVLVGAGIGALSSAAMGKSPFTGALLGGATGGLFGGSESLLGGKFADAFGQGAVGGVSKGIVAPVGELAKSVPSAGIQNIGQFAKPLASIADDAAIGSSLTKNIGIASSGMPSASIPLSTGDLAGGVGNNALNANMSKLFNYTPPTAMEKIQGAGTDLYSWAKDNPLSAGNIGLKGFELANQPPKPVDKSAQTPVRQGTYEGGAGVQLTPAASNVSPTILPVKPNKTGQIALDSVVQKHPELIQLYPNLFGGR
jgi:hypothetical protein